MNETRPNPDVLLAAITKEEQRRQRGRLKVFLGMCAGVGKTYAMLQAAAERKAEGVDVVIGYVETHKRPETDALLAGLEIVPRLAMTYRETILEEMDTDAILRRKPKLVLVDELAHTNAPGVRHLKRYQDVADLLAAGIDVYTTINVQHFESRADVVRQITGITVHETVPDSVLDTADEVELIDLSPDDLRKRLFDGKVYTAERIDTAAGNFFRVGNLTALREMALRLTAERVDHELQDYMQLKRIAGPWKSRERLMVAVGAGAGSASLVRWARRLAYNLEAPWLAVHVETSASLQAEDRERLARTLALARRMGAEVITIASDNVVDALLGLARQRNVTQLLIGKSPGASWWRLLSGGTLVDQLLRHGGDIDIYVLGGEAAQRLRRRRLLGLDDLKITSNWRDYLLALGLVAAITVANLTVLPLFGYSVVGLTELLGVLLIAFFFGRGPALVAAATSALLWNYLFIPPRFTFAIREVQDIFMVILYFAIALFAGTLTARLRSQEKLARANAERMTALFTLAHDVATAGNLDDVLKSGVHQIGRLFDGEVAILLPEGGHLARTPHPAGAQAVDDKDFGVATWVYDNGKAAGRHTETLPLASAQYHPLLTPTRTVGVIGINLRGRRRLTFDQAQLLETVVSQIALGVERELLDEAATQSAMLRESERLYTTLLNSISHELRTPIAGVAGAADSLLDPAVAADEATRRVLVMNIQEGADRLNRLVENLLDMSRLDSGRLQLRREWCDPGDLIATAVRRCAGGLAGHPLTVAIAPELPLVEVDFALIEQLLVNLIDNAGKYTPAATPIHLSAQVEGKQLVIRVTDAGPGIPVAEQERIFDKFYRLPGSASGGTGLGLSVCRGLAQAHGGTLVAHNVSTGGAQFVLRLPLGDRQPVAREIE